MDLSPRFASLKWVVCHALLLPTGMRLDTFFDSASCRLRFNRPTVTTCAFQRCVARSRQSNLLLSKDRGSKAEHVSYSSDSPTRSLMSSPAMSTLAKPVRQCPLLQCSSLLLRPFVSSPAMSSPAISASPSPFPNSSQPDTSLHCQTTDTRLGVSPGMPVHSPAFASTHCTNPRRDGQAELTWVAGTYPSADGHPSKY